MIRILVFLLLFPVTSFAASYKLSGDGSCYFSDTGAYGDCRAELTFNLDTFGAEVALTDNNWFRVYRGADEVFYSPVSWYADIPGVCTDACAYATTDAEGNLTDFWFRSFNAPTNASATMDEWSVDAGFILMPGGQGEWTVSAVPLPPSVLLFGGALILGLVVRYRTRRSA
jgi:hypothetical protein